MIEPRCQIRACIPPSVWSQSVSVHSPANASLTISIGALPGLALEDGGVNQAAVCTWVRTLLVYQCGTGSRRSSNAEAEAAAGPGPRPAQPHVLPGPHLGDLVDVFVGDHADHRIAAGDGVTGTKDHR